MGVFRALRLSMGIGVLVFGALAANGVGAAAYGAADQPLAQVEVSGNCNNPGFPLCAPPPAGVGLGGIWIWLEIDANSTADFAGAGCGHTVGGGGPGSAGGGGFHGSTTWTYATWASANTAGAFFFGIDPNNSYYLVNFGPDGLFAFPTTNGHYSFQPVPAVTIQLQIAP